MVNISVQHGGYTNKKRYEQERKGRGDIDIHIKYINILDEVIFFFPVKIQ